MPIAAVPAGVEIKKITPTQKKALDELLKKQKDADLQTELITTLIPTLAFVGVAATAGVTAWAYLNNEKVSEIFTKATEGAGLQVAKGLISFGGLITDFAMDAPAGSRDPEPRTGETTPQGNVLSKCQRFEADYVQDNELHDIPFVGTVLQATSQLNTIQKMKKEGCSKPSIIPQAQWDQG